MLKKWRLKVAFWKYQHDMADAGIPTKDCLSFHQWKTEMGEDDQSELFALDHVGDIEIQCALWRSRIGIFLG